MVADKSVVGDPVVLRAGGEVNAHGAVFEAIVFDAVEQRVVDEQRLALGAADHAVAGRTVAHVADDVVAQG
ncbi:hypothetical protein D3C85_1911230 [compost metagenome]